MFLQKHPPQTTTSDDHHNLAIRQVSKARRRTLQTISELSSEPSAWACPNSITKTTGDSGDTTTVSSNRSPKRPESGGFERRSIFSTEANAPHLPHPLIATRRTEQIDTGEHQDQHIRDKATGSGHVSSKFPLRSRYSEDDPVCPRQGKGTRQSRTGDPSLNSISDRRSGKASQRTSPADLQTTLGKSNSRKDIVRRMRGEGEADEGIEVEDLPRRRARGTRLALSSSSTLPSVSSLPSGPTNMKDGRNLQQLLQSNRALHGSPLVRLPNSMTDIFQTDKTPDFQFGIPMRSSTLGYARNGHFKQSLSLLNRSSSVPNTGRRVDPSIEGPASDLLSQNRASRSVISHHGSTIRTSSVSSATSINTCTSNGTKSSRRSSPSPRSHRSRRHQNGATKEYVEALADLTAAATPPDGKLTPESLAFLKEQRKKLDEKIRRSSVASERASRMSLIQEQRMSRSGSKALQYNHSDVRKSPKIMPETIINTECSNHSGLDGLTPEYVRLLREREKLLRWKAEREKFEFERRQREKIRERVRRANELEDARSKELEKSQKKNRTCCGLFGAR